MGVSINSISMVRFLLTKWMKNTYGSLEKLIGFSKQWWWIKPMPMFQLMTQLDSFLFLNRKGFCESIDESFSEILCQSKMIENEAKDLPLLLLKLIFGNEELSIGFLFDVIGNIKSKSSWFEDSDDEDESETPVKSRRALVTRVGLIFVTREVTGAFDVLDKKKYLIFIFQIDRIITWLMVLSKLEHRIASISNKFVRIEILELTLITPAVLCWDKHQERSYRTLKWRENENVLEHDWGRWFFPSETWNQSIVAHALAMPLVSLAKIKVCSTPCRNENPNFLYLTFFSID